MRTRPTRPPAASDSPLARLLGMPPRSALAVILVGISPLVFAAVLHARNRQLYYLSAQEDGLLEWATFWSLFLAALVFLWSAARSYRNQRRIPWFEVLVGLFCIFVAGEEISWGQRVLGFRPPTYFLEENFQQELNIHNVWDTDLRKLLAKATLLLYGVLLPVARLVPGPRRLFDRIGVAAPPAAVLPVFLGAFVIYHTYPWKFSGEIIEAAMGLGFLFAALAVVWRRREEDPPFPGVGLQQVGLSVTAVLALSAVSVGLTRVGADASGARHEEQARIELAAMGDDLMRDGRPLSRCGIHKRVYSWVEKYDVDELRHGAFARLVEEGVPADRAAYFIDPWNSPYWVRHRCADERRRQRLFVYSFGPDRRRQSTEWEIRGDDVGVVRYERGF